MAIYRCGREKNLYCEFYEKEQTELVLSHTIFGVFAWLALPSCILIW